MELFNRKSRLMLMLGLSLLAMLVGGCQRATIKGVRVGGTQPVTISKLYIYSFLRTNPGLQSDRFNRDVAVFEAALAKDFVSKGVPTTIVNGVEQAGLNGFSASTPSYESHVQNPIFSRVSGTELIPIVPMIASNRKAEIAFGATHRLVLFPAMMSTGDGVTFGSGISWSVQSTDSGATLAQGSLHYLLDVRGFPRQQMIDALRGQLNQLDIH